MATKKNDKSNEKLTFQVRKVLNFEEDDVRVSVNGKIYQIQRGVPVTLPRYVWEVIAEQNRLEEVASNFVKAKKEALKEKEKELKD